MKKTKSSYKMYPAWEFDREVKELDEQSRKGWQLTKGGCFHRKYQFDDGVRYRYALDFNQEISDPVRYREIFAEQGWEFVNSTFNGWHYFRKVFDPALPEEEYQIYTDTASRQEMAGRWRRLAYLLGGIELLLGAANLLMNIQSPAIHGFCLVLVCLMIGVLLIAAAKHIGFPSRRRSLISAKLFIPILALLVVALVFAGFRTASFSTQTEYIVPEDNDVWEIHFDVKLPDFYTLELNVDAPASVSVSVVNEAERDSVKAKVDGEWISEGGVIYTARGQTIDESAHLFLMPGSYCVSSQYDPGAEPGLTGQFEFKLE